MLPSPQVRAAPATRPVQPEPNSYELQDIPLTSERSTISNGFTETFTSVLRNICDYLVPRSKQKIYVFGPQEQQDYAMKKLDGYDATGLANSAVNSRMIRRSEKQILFCPPWYGPEQAPNQHVKVLLWNSGCELPGTRWSRHNAEYHTVIPRGHEYKLQTLYQQVAAGPIPLSHVAKARLEQDRKRHERTLAADVNDITRQAAMVSRQSKATVDRVVQSDNEVFTNFTGVQSTNPGRMVSIDTLDKCLNPVRTDEVVKLDQKIQAVNDNVWRAYKYHNRYLREVTSHQTGKPSQGYNKMHYLWPWLERFNPRRVLDLGCGMGGFGAYIASKTHLEYETVDRKDFQKPHRDYLLHNAKNGRKRLYLL